MLRTNSFLLMMLIFSFTLSKLAFAESSHIEATPSNCVTIEQDCVMNIKVDWFTEATSTVCIRVTDQQVRLFCQKPKQGDNFFIAVRNNQNIVLELLTEQLIPLESTEINVFYQNIKKRRRDIAWSIF